MNWKNELYITDEQPLDRLVEGYSNTAIFRKIAFVGDSMSSGEFETRDKDGNPGYHDLYDYSWGQYIARKNGLTAYNFSRGGMTAKEYVESFAQANGFWDEDKVCQAYVMALGVNDIYNFRYEVGSVEDINMEDYRQNKPTTIGYYASIIQRYKTMRPDAKFFLVTIPNNIPADFPEETAAFREELYKLAEMFDNTYILDLYQYGPVLDETFREHYYLHGHMTPSGYIMIAKLIDSYIHYLVKKNPADFKYTGLVGSGIDY